MKIRVISCAEQEFVETVDYYNDQCSGLGYEFAAEVNNTFDRIKFFPDAWPFYIQPFKTRLTAPKNMKDLKH